MASVVIGKVADIPPGERKIVVPFRGRAGIGVFNVNGSFYAVRNICLTRTVPSAPANSAVGLVPMHPPLPVALQSPLTA